MKSAFVFLFIFWSASSQAEIVESIVAIVNGDIVTRYDVEKFNSKLKSGSIIDDLFGTNPEDLLKDQKSLLSHMVNEKLVDDEVKKQNAFVTVERVEQEINSIQARHGINREQLITALKNEGTKFSEYQAFIKKRLERQDVIGKTITSKIKVSDEDVIAAYESKNKAASAKSFEYKISHILLREGKRPDAEQLKRAQTVLEKLKKGGSFEALASQYSEDPSYNEGGFLGSFRAGEFLKALEDGVKVLSPGEFGGPIKTKLGYHVVKLLDRTVVPDASFESKKEQIRRELEQNEFKKQSNHWLALKRQESFIRIN